MPVRKIPLKYSSLSGTKPSKKTGRITSFESSLEADFIDLLEWDIDVRHYEEQPYKIEFLDNDNRPRYYIPDFLVSYTQNAQNEDLRNKNIIYEVKYSKDLESNKMLLDPKFKAATEFCKREGFSFNVITEKQIRTHYLENIKFLKRYRNQDVHLPMIDYLNELLQKFETTTPEILIASASEIEEKRAMLLHALWCMVASGTIMIDMTKKITMTSTIWMLKK